MLGEGTIVSTNAKSDGERRGPSAAWPAATAEASESGGGLCDDDRPPLQITKSTRRARDPRVRDLQLHLARDGLSQVPN